jgi:phosphatidate cytidylyltransferase
MAMARSETMTRVAVAAVGIPIVLGAVYLGGWVLGALLAAVAALASLEFYRMAERKGVRPLSRWGSSVAAAWVLLAASQPEAGPVLVAFSGLLVLFVLITAAAVIWLRGVEGQPLLCFAVTVLGVLYTGGLLSYGLYLRHMPGTTGAWHGAALLFAPILLTWASDTFAYFVGRAWGKRKLIPQVSPGKTVEGAIGALLGAAAVAALYSMVLAQFPTYVLHPFTAVIFGLLISVAAQTGDLAESLLKRDAGVKDSGTLLPGHGGALDRFDSLLFTLPLAYLFFLLLGAPGTPGGGF